MEAVMKPAELKRLAVVSRECSYNATAKNEFRRLSRKLLKEVAELTQLGTADLRYNEGGIAVSGEATLHTDLVYIQVSSIDLGILVRVCKGRKDYHGGPNQWYAWSRVVEYGAQGLAQFATQLVAREQERVMQYEKAASQS
jgi:hypothetical protein